MAFRLTADESVEKSIRRIVGEELECAISSLRKEDESLRGQGIHDARKSIKKLRSLTRLLMPGVGPAGVRDNRSLRDAGRALSGLRDAAALIETVEALSEQYGSDPAMEQLAVVRSALRRRLEDTVRAEDCKTVIGGAVASLKTLKKRAVKWPIAGAGFASIAPGLEGAYRRARKRLRIAQGKPDAGNLHALRKRVKDHWYHVRLLDGVFSPSSKGDSRERELARIQQWLGDDHDLTVLRDAIVYEPTSFGGKKVTPAVLELIGRAQKELREKALAAAALVYQPKPKTFVEEAGEAWERWLAGTTGSKPADAEHASRPARARGSAA